MNWSVVIRDVHGTRFFGVTNDTPEGAVQEAFDQLPLGYIANKEMTQIFAMPMTDEYKIDIDDAVENALSRSDARSRIQVPRPRHDRRTYL